METEQIKSSEVVEKKSYIDSFFGNNDDFAFVYKKTEKLVSATYLVTNLYSDHEPMKWNLRRKSSDLLSYILGYNNVQNTITSDFIFTLKSKVMEINSLLEVSLISGLISNMNFSVLKQEYDKLIDVVDSKNFSENQPIFGTISKDFFVQGVQSFQQSQHKGQLPAKGSVQSDSAGIIKGSIPERDIEKRSNRQNVIIGLLKRKKELTIKDIALVIKDCSEKTIQRELTALIASGVVKREGERRWSKYFLSVV